MALKKLPFVPKMAYIFTKVANSIIMYTKDELPYKVKSYDLKNATLYLVEYDRHIKRITGLPSEIYSTDDVTEVMKFALRICYHGFKSTGIQR